MTHLTTVRVPTLRLDVQLGAFTVLVGPHGHGKSTILRAVGGVAARADGPGPDQADAEELARHARTMFPSYARPAGRGELEVTGLLAAALRARRAGQPVTADDVGGALHPRLVRPFVAALRAIGAQTVLATHAPHVVDAFDVDEVLVVRDGFARRLSEHPQAAAWSGLLRAGEAWVRFGEEWTDGPADAGAR